MGESDLFQGTQNYDVAAEWSFVQPVVEQVLCWFMIGFAYVYYGGKGGEPPSQTIKCPAAPLSSYYHRYNRDGWVKGGYAARPSPPSLPRSSPPPREHVTSKTLS